MKTIKHIHKLFLTASILLLALIVMACSNDSEERTEPQNCNCWTILQATSYTLPNQAPQSVLVVANDCNGLQKQITRVGIYVVGNKICDN